MSAVNAEPRKLLFLNRKEFGFEREGNGEERSEEVSAVHFSIITL